MVDVGQNDQSKIYNKYHNKVTKYCKECHLTTLCKSILELHLHFLLKKLFWLATTYDTLKYWLHIILYIWLELFSTTLRHSLLFQSRAKSHLINNLLMLLLKTQNYAIWRFRSCTQNVFSSFFYMIQTLKCLTCGVIRFILCSSWPTF